MGDCSSDALILTRQNRRRLSKAGGTVIWGKIGERHATAQAGALGV
jgi:hypothetical protein